ncbi:MAG: hypothetical protein JKY20_11240 [Alphaproteobacteria bacterium]|nr:hypothetical protein [Alphaproteobacteria bacterium]
MSRSSTPIRRYNVSMDSNIDIIMSARMLIEQHGDKAVEIAAQGEYEMLERGDEKGAAIWKRIFDAVTDDVENAVLRA